MKNGQYLSPYINFGGRAREAMEFYHSVLGGELELHAMDEKGTPRPAHAGDRIGHARLEAEGLVIVGSDGHPKYPATAGDNIAIAIGGTDRERLTMIFDGLAEGGKVKGKLTRGPWGTDDGYLLDRFGVNWIISIGAA